MRHPTDEGEIIQNLYSMHSKDEKSSIFKLESHTQRRSTVQDNDITTSDYKKLIEMPPEDSDISTINKLSILTAGARCQLLNVNQQLLKYKIIKVIDSLSSE